MAAGAQEDSFTSCFRPPAQDPDRICSLTLAHRVVLGLEKVASRFMRGRTRTGGRAAEQVPIPGMETVSIHIHFGL